MQEVKEVTSLMEEVSFGGWLEFFFKQRRADLGHWEWEMFMGVERRG